MTGAELSAAIDTLRNKLLKRSRFALANVLAIEAASRVFGMHCGDLTPEILDEKLDEVAAQAMSWEENARVHNAVKRMDRVLKRLKSVKPPHRRRRRRP